MAEPAARRADAAEGSVARSCSSVRRECFSCNQVSFVYNHAAIPDLHIRTNTERVSAVASAKQSGCLACTCYQLPSTAFHQLTRYALLRELRAHEPLTEV
jgi:hypothetical protein